MTLINRERKGNFMRSNEHIVNIF